MKNLGDTLFGRLLGRLADEVIRHPKRFILPQVILAAGCVVFALCFLKFDTDRDNLVGSDKKYHKLYLQYKKEFPAQDDLVVVAESDEPEKNRQFVERLGTKLEKETNLFTSVFYKGNLQMMGHKALLFASDDDLEQMYKMLGDYRPFIQRFTRTTNLVSFFSMVNTSFRTAKQETNAANESLIGALPALERIVTQARECLSRSGRPPTPGVTALFGGGEDAEQQIYITFAEGHIFLVTAQARTGSLNNAAVERMRKLMEETRAEVPGLNVGLTGGPVLEHDEMVQSQKDTTLAGIVSLILCSVIFIVGYRSTGRPVKAVLCLLIGLAYTIGFATLVIGHLNLLTITFLPMLIGLAIDFGVHLVTRFEEELRHGQTPEGALKIAMVYTGQGIFTGAFTTAGAFLAIGLTDFKGIQEMGIISGGGLMICLVPMLTMLPALLLRGRQNVLDNRRGGEPLKRARIEQFWLKRPIWVTATMVLLCGACWTQFHKVGFDYDLLHMQSRNMPAVVFEQKLIDSTPKSVLFAAVVADSADQALALEKQLRGLTNIVSDVESVSRFLVGDQSHKLELIGKIKQEVTAIQFTRMDTNTVDVQDLSQTLWSLQGYLGMGAEAAKDAPEIQKQLVALRDSITALRKKMLAGKAGNVASRLAAFQQSLFTDIRQTFEAIKTQDNQQALRPQDLPPALRDRFVGVTGKFLLQVYPKKDVWQHDNQKEFVDGLRQALDPDRTNVIITGEPVQLLEYTTLLKDSYQTAAWYALAAIAVLVFIHFRNLWSVFLALVPVAVGAIWLGGFMGLCHISFNPANIMTLPLVIGIGVTNGIQILNRFAEEHTPDILSKSTGKAVLVSGLNTIAGFGSLILAKHQGIQSLGYVMSVGVATCMIAALAFLPALLNLIYGKKKTL